MSDGKFAGFDLMIEDAKANKLDVIMVHHPEALGDNYSELVTNLNKIASAGVMLHVLPPDKRGSTDLIREHMEGPPPPPGSWKKVEVDLPKTADGGDVIIRAGRAGEGDPLRDILPGNPGNIRFKTPDDEDVLVIRGDGSAWVRGTEVPATDNGNRQVFQTFVEWLRNAFHVADAPEA
jgi:hypothetical protein